MQATLDRLKQRRQERGDEGGFTLIELLIVIVILAILAAIVVFAVQNLTGKSTTAACKADYKTVETALEAYKAQETVYPATLAALTSAVGTDGPWLKEVPSNTGYSFTYTPGTPATTYTLTVGGTVTNCPT